MLLIVANLPHASALTTSLLIEFCTPTPSRQEPINGFAPHQDAGRSWADRRRETRPMNVVASRTGSSGRDPSSSRRLTAPPGTLPLGPERDSREPCPRLNSSARVQMVWEAAIEANACGVDHPTLRWFGAADGRPLSPQASSGTPGVGPGSSRITAGRRSSPSCPPRSGRGRGRRRRTVRPHRTCRSAISSASSRYRRPQTCPPCRRPRRPPARP